MTAELLDDAVEFLETIPALTFILIRDARVGSGPTLASVVEMVTMACRGMGSKYSGPLPESEFSAQKAKALQHREAIVAAVQQRLEELKDAGAEFILGWHIPGHAEPRLDSSGNPDWADACEDLVDALQHEIACQLDC